MCMKEELSQNEVNKILLIDECLKGIRSTKEVAHLLAISIRQVQRLVRKVRETGRATSVLHGNREKKPHNRLTEDIYNRIISLALGDLIDLNYAHLRDVLEEEYNICVSRSTIERICKNIGRKPAVLHKKTIIHRRRKPRSHFGELVQLDATSEPWVKNSSKRWNLHGAIDDATGTVVGLYFCIQECLLGYTHLVLQMNKSYGLPKEFYTDGRTVFNYKKANSTIEEELNGSYLFETQFQRAANKNNISIHIAKSPQAKGKIERLWRTLHDRLKKDIWRKNIQTINDANKYLSSFIKSFNKHFAYLPSDPCSAWRSPIPKKQLLFDFAFQETRKLDHTFSFRFNGRLMQVPMRILNNNTPESFIQTIKVAKSDLIGIQACYNGQIFSPEIIPTISKTTIPKNSKKHRTKPAPDHPWRKSFK